jgi:carboxylesterase type B
VIDGDFIPENPISLLKEGRSHTGIDYMTGWVMDEATAEVPTHIAIAMQAAGWLSARYPQLQLPVSLQIIYLYLTGDYAARSVCPEAVSTAWCATSRALRDMEVTCPALQQAKLMADAVEDQDQEHAASANLYVYELNQTSFAASLDSYGKSYLGVVHFSDVPYVFNELETAYGINSTEDKALAKRISADWAAFATYGRPNASSSHGWPRLATAEGKGQTAAPAAILPQIDLQVLGGPNGRPRKMSFSERSRCEFIQGLFEDSTRY